MFDFCNDGLTGIAILDTQFPSFMTTLHIDSSMALAEVAKDSFLKLPKGSITNETKNV